MSEQCEHGQLKRQCQVCELIAERDDLLYRLRIARWAIFNAGDRARVIRDNTDPRNAVEHHADRIRRYCQEALADIPDPTQYEVAK